MQIFIIMRMVLPPGERAGESDADETTLRICAAGRIGKIA
jgi:hypothetical protein